MKILTLDFEGSLRNGIREIGAITSINEKIIGTEEKVISKNQTCTNILISMLRDRPQLFASHNVQTEKNLLKRYLPYSNENKQSKNILWGPWIDTMEVYKILYPQIDQYDLSYLTNLFIKEESLEMGTQYCKEGKISHHNALYDALCTFLLLRRIIGKVNIRPFIH